MSHRGFEQRIQDVEMADAASSARVYRQTVDR
jgi:hypothetical protein